MKVVKCPSCGAGVLLENQYVADGPTFGTMCANVTCAYCGSMLESETVCEMLDQNDPRNDAIPIAVGAVVTGTVTNIVGPVSGPIFSGNFHQPIVFIDGKKK